MRRAVRRPKDVRRAQVLHIVLATCDAARSRRGLRCALLGTCLVVRLRYRVIHHWKEESALFTTVYHCVSGSSGETVPLALALRQASHKQHLQSCGLVLEHGKI